MVGPSDAWPWTCYILADVADQETVGRVQSVPYHNRRRVLACGGTPDRGPRRPPADHPGDVGGGGPASDRDRYREPCPGGQGRRPVHRSGSVRAGDGPDLPPDLGLGRARERTPQPGRLQKPCRPAAGDRHPGPPGRDQCAAEPLPSPGRQLCETPRGNGNGFTCPYHAWSYALDGKLRGIPYPTATRTCWRRRTSASTPQAGVYGGMVFASFNQDIEPLEDFLGGAKVWIDRFMKQGAGYPVKVQGEHRFRFKGNWKIQLENTTDGYHFPIVHRSWMSSVDAETADMLSFMTDEKAVTHALGNGHSVTIMVPSTSIWTRTTGRSRCRNGSSHLEELSETIPAEVRRIVRSMHGAGFNLNLFPNVAMSRSFFRVLRPISVTETEVRHVALGLEGGPEIVNRERLRIHEHFQGPFGFGSPDDSEAWDRVQRGAVGGPDVPILVNRGLGREVRADNGNRPLDRRDRHARGLRDVEEDDDRWPVTQVRDVLSAAVVVPSCRSIRGSRKRSNWCGVRPGSWTTRNTRSGTASGPPTAGM